MTPTQVANPSKTSLRSTANSICDTTKKSQQFYLENFPGQHLQDKNGKSKASLKSAFEVMEKYKGQEMLHETDSEVSSAEDNEFEIDDDEDQSDAEIKVEDDWWSEMFWWHFTKSIADKCTIEQVTESPTPVSQRVSQV